MSVKVKNGQTVESIENTRWKGCKRVVVKIKNRRMRELSQNNEMRWEIKRFERGETGEDIRREEGEMVVIKARGRKEVE